ncbi:MAG: hypothetical protein ACUVXF_04435 [Desulfobaccales bacterium]
MNLRVLILISLVIALAGCRALPPAPTELELTADQVLSRLKAGQSDLSSFSGRGRLTLISPHQNATGTAVVLGKFPETLRVELKDPLGRSVLTFFTDGRIVEILFPREGKLLQGPATPTNLASFVPPPVTLPQALRLLAGDLPLSQGTPNRSHFEVREKSYVLEWLKDDGSLQERLWVAVTDFQPHKLEWFGKDGQIAFSVDLADFQQVAPGRPQNLKLKTQNPPMELRLAYRNFTSNPTLTAADLTVPRPPGVTVLPLKP